MTKRPGRAFAGVALDWTYHEFRISLFPFLASEHHPRRGMVAMTKRPGRAFAGVALRVKVGERTESVRWSPLGWGQRKPTHGKRALEPHGVGSRQANARKTCVGCPWGPDHGRRTHATGISADQQPPARWSRQGTEPGEDPGIPAPREWSSTRQGAGPRLLATGQRSPWSQARVWRWEPTRSAL